MVDNNITDTEKLVNVFFPQDWDDEKKNNLYINIWTLNPENQQKLNFFYNMAKKKSVFNKIRFSKKICNLYWGMGYRNKGFVVNNQGKRGGVDDVVGIPWLWVEMDVKGDGHKESNLPESKEEAKELLESLIPDCPPSCIVDSGGDFMPSGFFLSHGFSLMLMRETWQNKWRRICFKFYRIKHQKRAGRRITYLICQEFSESRGLSISK